MTPLMYEVPSDPTITRVTITAESVKEHVSPAVEHDPDRTQRPRLGGAALHAEQGAYPPREMSLKQQLNRVGRGASLAPFCIKSLSWKEVNV